MDQPLPPLVCEDLRPTRDYLQEVALVLSSLQRRFLPKHPRLWQYGLEVSLRGLSTQAFLVGDEEVRASLDLVRHKVRLDGQKWALHETTAPEIFHDFEAWAMAHGASKPLKEPDFASGLMSYDTMQAEAYAEALWWMEAQFRQVKATLNSGTTSPILLYPHHFDLALSWFPLDTPGTTDERQLTLGWSTGDETIAEPYMYLSAYPEPAGLHEVKLPPGAQWQTTGFNGAVLRYDQLVVSTDPASLLAEFARVFQGVQALY